MHSLLQDLRFSLRLLTKSPAFTVTALLVLALGIGVNTAIFSLVHELAFSARPWPQEKQVVQLYTQDLKKPERFRMFSYPAYQQIRGNSDLFSDVLAHNLTLVGVGEREATRRTFGAIGSANYFSTLQVPLLRGRAFLPEEEKPGAAAPVVIVSYNYWKREGLAADLIGRVIRVNERPYTVVGIAPEGFSGTTSLMGPELYFPLSCYEQLSNDYDATARRTLERADAYNLFLVARFKPGVTGASAEPALQAMAAHFRGQFPVEFKDQTLTSRPLPRLSTSNAPAEESMLTVLGTTLVVMSGLVLLIASLNLANMLLARGMARRKEFAVRLALGGARSRIVRQLLTEGFVLALGGGVLGFVLGSSSTTLLIEAVGRMAPISLFFHGATNPALYAATFGFCTFATLFFALGPALRFSRVDVLADLKEQAGEDTSGIRPGRILPRNLLVVAQLALSLGLLVVAGLFIRGASAAGSIETGFRAEDTLLVELDASLAGYQQDRALPLYRSVTERLAALPGVQSAGIGSVVPFGIISISRGVQLAGVQPAPDAKPATAAEGLAFNARWNSVGAGYFTTIGLPLLRGRVFNTVEADEKGAPAVAIVDEVLARRLFPQGDALGQRIQFAVPGAPTAAGGGGSSSGVNKTIPGKSSSPPAIEIIGIVPATKWELFGDSSNGVIYVPFAQGYQSNIFLHVKTAAVGEDAQRAMIGAVRRELGHSAPGVPVLGIKTFRQHLDSSFQLWVTRVGAAMFAIFGSLAMTLAAVGLYGVKAYAVARRTREIGIRMALGAEPGKVQAMILREGLSTTLLGVGLGLILGLALSQLVKSMVYKVSPFDPVTFLLAPLVLTAAAALACWLPARKATRVSPLVALRSE
jgi:predicted permease